MQFACKIVVNVCRCWSAMEMSVWDPQVEVFRDNQTLLFKAQDVTVARLLRVFKVRKLLTCSRNCVDAKFIHYRFTMVQVKPQMLYLEEDVTMNAEFPEEGKFHLSLLPGNRYKVCGDPEEVQGSEPTPSSS